MTVATCRPRLDRPPPRCTTPAQPISKPMTPAATSHPQWNSARYSMLSHREFDAAVLRLAFGGIVGGDRLRLTVADGVQPVGGEACAHHVVEHRLRPSLR